VPWSAEEMDPGKWWVIKEVGHLQRDELPCRSGKAQETQQGHGCTKNPERTDVQKETSGTTGMQQWHKGPRHNLAPTSNEGDDNRQQHQRTQQETGVMSEKHEDII
jgi:hypothetical protein